MNDKGFTLIELLAVIIILTLLVSIVSIAADKVIKNSKKQLSETQIENIEKAANAYYLKEGIVNSFNNRSFKMCVNLSYLIDNDYIEDEELLNIKNKEKLNGSIEITYNDVDYTYKYKENSCTYEYKAINEICRAVTKETITTGNIPQGNYLPGDEYVCEVKNNTKYHFFVLSTEKDNVNLIMNKNINSDGTPVTKAIQEYDKTSNGGIYNLVDWINQDSYESAGGQNWADYEDLNYYGPITAMNYLNSATSSWSNIPNLNIAYDDEEGHFTNFPVTGKARLPYHSEANDVGCLDYEALSCPVWMADYLTDAGPDYDTTYQENPIERTYGYWTFDSVASNSYNAWRVRYDGCVDGDDLGWYLDDYESDHGVRPVISIPKLDIAN